MGLFRRARKNREKAAAALVPEQAGIAAAPAAAARREVTIEARPDPDQPGWGDAIGQQIGTAHQHRPSQE